MRNLRIRIVAEEIVFFLTDTEPKHGVSFIVPLESYESCPDKAEYYSQVLAHIEHCLEVHCSFIAKGCQP